MNLPDFTSPFWFAAITLAFFGVVIGRYLFIAGVFYLIFYKWFPQKWKERKINEKAYKKGQFKKEVMWSTVTAMLFALAGTITLVWWQKGYTKISYKKGSEKIITKLEYSKNTIGGYIKNLKHINFHYQSSHFIIF